MQQTAAAGFVSALLLFAAAAHSAGAEVPEAGPHRCNACNCCEHNYSNGGSALQLAAAEQQREVVHGL
jgi:hypothetical protein